MSVDQNKALIRRLYEEALNKGNLEVVDEIIAPNYIRHGLAPGTLSGPESTKQVFVMMRTAFPDTHVTVEDQVVEGDKAVHRVTLRGTHKGNFMDIAPTNKQVEATAIIIDRISGGKVMETWAEVDMMGMMQQLGAIPPPG